jgi:hypothetical protein
MWSKPLCGGLISYLITLYMRVRVLPVLYLPRLGLFSRDVLKSGAQGCAVCGVDGKSA